MQFPRKTTLFGVPTHDFGGPDRIRVLHRKVRCFGAPKRQFWTLFSCFWTPFWCFRTDSANFNGFGVLSVKNSFFVSKSLIFPDSTQSPPEKHLGAPRKRWVTGGRPHGCPRQRHRRPPVTHHSKKTGLPGLPGRHRPLETR